MIGLQPASTQPKIANPTPPQPITAAAAGLDLGSVEHRFSTPVIKQPVIAATSKGTSSAIGMMPLSSITAYSAIVAELRKCLSLQPIVGFETGRAFGQNRLKGCRGKVPAEIGHSSQTGGALIAGRQPVDHHPLPCLKTGDSRANRLDDARS